MKEYAKLRRDLSPRLKKLMEEDRTVAWGENDLDTDREPLTEEQAEKAWDVSSPCHAGEEKKAKKAKGGQ